MIQSVFQVFNLFFDRSKKNNSYFYQSFKPNAQINTINFILIRHFLTFFFNVIFVLLLLLFKSKRGEIE